MLGAKGELIIDRESKKAETLLPEHELPGTRVQSLLVDREKSLWIGTNGGLAAGSTARSRCCRSPIRWRALRFSR